MFRFASEVMFSHDMLELITLELAVF